MALQESGEMYLESILVLSRQKPYVRAVDIAEHLGYSKPSVSRAMSILRQGAYILVDRDGGITLTEKGKSVAEAMFERHTMLTAFLVSLGVDPEVAALDACKIEHVISTESFEAMKRRLEQS